MAGADHLRDHIAAGSRLDRAGDDHDAEGVGGRLTERFVLDAAAAGVELVECRAGEGLDVIEDLAVFQRERVGGDAQDRAFVGGNFLSGFFAPVADFFRHVAGAREDFVIGVDESREWFRRFGHAGHGGIVDRFAIEVPLAFAFLDEPESCDVFEETHALIHAKFVAETALEGLGCGDRGVDFHAHDRPCAGGEPKFLPIAHRDAGDCGCGVVAG